MTTRRAVHGFIHISMRAVQLFLRFRIKAFGTVCLGLRISVQQRVIARRGRVNRHAMGSLAIVVIRVITAHMATLWLNQTFLALHVAPALQAFIIRFGPSAVRSAAVMSVGGRRSWIVAVGARVDVSGPPTVRGLAESAALLPSGRGLARSLRQRHCGPTGGVSVRWLIDNRGQVWSRWTGVALTLRSPRSCTAVFLCNEQFSGSE